MSTGWDEASIKTFKNAPFNNLGREVIQNSLDAAHQGACVRVCFTLRSVATADIPGVKTLKSVIGKCLEINRNGQESAKQEIALAKRLMEKDAILVMSISESGTTGMEGPCEAFTPFFNYMKGNAQTAKSSGNRGSHGVGKAAPIACSRLHTIFASTIYKKNGKAESLVMGRANLSSHRENGIMKHNVGFWGNDSEPIEYSENDFDWLKRENRGTDIHIIGFRVERNWELMLAASVAQNFFSAIHRGKLEVEIAKDSTSPIIIDSDTLPTIFKLDKIHNALKSTQDVSGTAFANAYGLYQALIAPDYEKSAEVKHLGHVKFYIKECKDSQEKRTGLIRDNMFITSKIPYFRKRQSWNGFAVLVEPVTDEGCKLIRAMEPPAHDDIQESWINDEGERDKATIALKQMADKMRAILEDLFGNPDIETSDIFGDWFSYQGDSGIDDDDPMAGFRFTRKEPPKSTNKAISTPDPDPIDTDEDIGDEGGKSTSGGGGGDGPGDGPGHGDGEGGTGEKTHRKKKLGQKLRENPIELRNVRMIPLADDKLKLIFQSTISGKILLSVSEMGADTQRLLSISESSEGNTFEAGANEGMVELVIVKNQKNTLEVTLNDYTGHSIRLDAIRAKEE
ncbi:MAG: hypothetical protein MJE68_17715 [Proteobacteria bacterium]|nr:hypothetical protein [Pseudomonadota bacterium]